MKTCGVTLYFGLLLLLGFICDYHVLCYTSRHVRKLDNNPPGSKRRDFGFVDFINAFKGVAEKPCVCGVSNVQNRRIVGGTIAKPNEFPWQAGLSEGYTRPYCGGTLINDLFILSAGHCVYGNTGELGVANVLCVDELHFPDDGELCIYPSVPSDTMATIVVRSCPKVEQYATQRHPSRIKALLAEHDNESEDDQAFFVLIEDLLPHPNYDDEDLIHDIGLVRLAERIPFTDITLPPCFPPPGVEYGGQMALVSGWGRLEEGGEASQLLRKVEVPIIPWDECYARYQGEEEILDDMLCAAWDEGKKDACEGDSGGPLVWKNDGRWYLIGVVSWGIGCGLPDQPAIYTRVDEYYSWIDHMTKDATTCTG